VSPDHRTPRGFILIELLVIIVILGILAAVVVFAVSGMTATGKASACTIEVRRVNTALQAFTAKSASNAFPSGTVVSGATGMFGQLEAAGLIRQTAPGASAAYTPTYDGAGNYAATCPG
jgi:type II secretory pathway pseudopilin PulG